MKTKTSVKSAANNASGMSRRCGVCPLHPCSMTQLRICHAAFVEGFQKGAEWKRKQIKTSSEK